jgi:hypothetical protein
MMGSLIGWGSGCATTNGPVALGCDRSGWAVTKAKKDATTNAATRRKVILEIPGCASVWTYSRSVVEKNPSSPELYDPSKGMTSGSLRTTISLFASLSGHDFSHAIRAQNSRAASKEATGTFISVAPGRPVEPRLRNKYPGAPYLARFSRDVGYRSFRPAFLQAWTDLFRNLNWQHTSYRG